MKILAIDPGPSESAFVRWDGESVLHCGMRKNEDIFAILRNHKEPGGGSWTLAVEMVACYGMPVGREVFETCLAIGRMQEIYYTRCLDLGAMLGCELVYRQDVKMHLCQSMRAKDANIRQALIDRFGKPGTKANPGKLYSISGHLWSALAIAVTVADKAVREAAA